MQIKAAGARRARGFSLIELLVVVSIILIVAAIAMPSILTAMDDVRLHSSMRDVIGLMQQSRETGVKNNKFYTILTTGNGNRTVYVDLSGDGAWQPNSQNCPGANCVLPEPAIQLPGNVTWTAAGAPNFQLNLAGNNFAPQAPTVMPSFNARGLPCIVAGNTCNSHSGAMVQGTSGANIAFLYYFSQQRTFGPQGWAAVTVSSAGRMKAWFYQASTNSWSQ